MKTMSIIAALVALSTSAFAGVKLETRTDYQDSTYNTDAALKGYSTTQLTRARLGGSLKATDDLSVTARFDLLGNSNASTVVATSNGAPTLVEYAYVSYKLIPALTVTMGKLAVVGGGIEGLYDTGDLYFASALGGYTAPLGSTFLGGGTASTAAPGGNGGVGLTYVYGDHTFDVQFLNDAAATPAANQKNNATKTHTAAQYLGLFLDKKLTAIVDYDAYKIGDNNRTGATVGAKYDFGVLVADLDYGMMTDESGTTLGATAGKKDEASGFVLNLTVPVSAWNILVKAESTATKNNGNKLATITNVGVAGEYGINKDHSANFHVAYNVLSAKNEATSGSVSANGLTVANGKTATENQLFVGFKLYADLIK